jgi:hypothetical protein
MDVIWGKREGKYFLEKDWTGRNRLIWLWNFVFTRGAGMPAFLSMFPPGDQSREVKTTLRCDAKR